MNDKKEGEAALFYYPERPATEEAALNDRIDALIETVRPQLEVGDAVVKRALRTCFVYDTDMMKHRNTANPFALFAISLTTSEFHLILSSF